MITIHLTLVKIIISILRELTQQVDKRQDCLRLSFLPIQVSKYIVSEFKIDLTEVRAYTSLHYIAKRHSHSLKISL